VSAPAGPALMSFDEACGRVVGHLKEHIPLAFWSVSRLDGDHQVHDHVRDDAYGIPAGAAQPWSETFCRYMVAGSAPQIAPDAMAVPQYAAVAESVDIRVGAYAGVPIRAGDGSLFGTLCGFDPQAQDADLLEHAPLLHLMATLLGQILHAERMRAEAADREAELRWTTLHDPLTGLPNRAMFLDLVARALGRDAGSAAPRPAVLLLDLDDFAAVNDTFGHAAGDDLLVEIAGRLSTALKPFDAVARLSGDEFAILLDDGEDLAAAGTLVESVLAEPFMLDAVRIPVSATVGVAPVPADPTLDVDTVLARADIAKHAAKSGSQGRFAIYDPTMTLPAVRDLKLREPLREAIRSGAVEAVYQPIVELDSGRVIAFEALARWTHDGAAVPPDVFVPVADRSGLLPELTDHMMELAASQLVRWSTILGHQRLQVGVNVPPCLIVDPTFPDRVERCIRRHGLTPQQLILEITEDALLTDPAAAQAGARRLHEIGATLSLDDFGTGYSSLLHLQQIPLHSVKIDRGFTNDLEANDATRRFMRAVLALGRDLGLRVVVEGVERHTQADVLHRLFGTHAQGHYFGRPARPEEIDVRPDEDETGPEQNGTETDGTETDGTETDGTELDGTELDGTELDSTELDSTEQHSTEQHSTEQHSTEQDGTGQDETELHGAEQRRAV
jgi:diguanylate cyclase (GGDEF)-like protein